MELLGKCQGHRRSQGVNHDFLNVWRFETGYSTRFPSASEAAGFQRDRDPDSGAGYRREHRDLQYRQRRIVATTALSERGSDHGSE